MLVYLSVKKKKFVCNLPTNTNINKLAICPKGIPFQLRIKRQKGHVGKGQQPPSHRPLRCLLTATYWISGGQRSVQQFQGLRLLVSVNGHK